MRVSIHQMAVALIWLLAGMVLASESRSRNLMYLTGQHDMIPDNEDLVKPITHVVLAFLPSDMFMEDDRNKWPLFRSVDSAREAFVDGTQILVAIGGWGDTGFSVAARNDAARKTFAKNVARMVQATGADGVDIDWEYPGGNGEDYKRVPNSRKAWEIEAYPLLLGEIRAALGDTKLMTAAVPGLERDMIAFTELTVPRIMRHLNFLNVMTYDLMNRRDALTRHHSSIRDSRAALQTYMERGASPERLNLGLGFYVKWFRTDPEDRDCGAGGGAAVGCRTLPLEDPKTGADLGNAGGFSWHDRVPEELEASFQRATEGALYDDEDGATYYHDREASIWWTFDQGTNGDITRKLKTLRGEMKLGGVFAWGLGEDGMSFTRLSALLGVSEGGSLGSGAMQEEGSSKEGEQERDEL